MAISKELLDILACPLCKKPVELTADESGLRCGDGSHRCGPSTE